MAEILKTLIPGGGGDYTLMSVAESDNQQDLTIGNTFVLECYRGQIDESVGVLWSDWITGASNFITIKAADGEGHGGVIGAGFVMNCTATATQALRTNQNYSQIIGIEVNSPNNNGGLYVQATEFYVSECIAVIPSVHSGYCLEISGGTAGVSRVENSLFIGQRYGCYIINFSSVEITNCTFAEFRNGGMFKANGAPVIKNTVAYSDDPQFAWGWTGTGWGAASTNNASSDTSAPGTSPQTGITTTDFTDFAGGDYSPAVSGKLDGTGADLSTDFDYDIAGAPRTDPWTIGAYIVSGATPVIQFDGPDIIGQSGTEGELYTFDGDGDGIVASRFSGSGAPFVYAPSPIGTSFPEGININATTGNPFGIPTVPGSSVGLRIRAGEQEPAELFTDITTTGSITTWDGTTLHMEGGTSTGTWVGTPVSGDEYHVVFDYTVDADHIMYIRCGGGGNQAVIQGPETGTFDAVLTAHGTDYLVLFQSSTGAGDYTNFSFKHFIETSGVADSNPFSMDIEPGVTPPTGVDGGGPYSGKVGTPIQLNGSYTAGSDPTPTLLWTVFSGGTGTFLPNATTEDPTFTPDDPGDYVLRFHVDPDDGTAIIATADLQATQEFAVAGDVTYEFTPSGGYQFNQNHIISGSSGVEFTPAADMATGAGYQIDGSSPVSLLPSAQMAYGTGAAINGSSGVKVTPAGLMAYATTFEIAGDSAITLTPVAGIAYGIEIRGNSSVAFTPAADLGYSFTREFVGDSAMQFIPNALMSYGALVHYTPENRSFTVPREKRAFVVN